MKYMCVYGYESCIVIVDYFTVQKKQQSNANYQRLKMSLNYLIYCT